MDDTAVLVLFVSCFVETLMTKGDLLYLRKVNLLESIYTTIISFKNIIHEVVLTFELI